MRKLLATALCCLLSSAAWAGSSTVNYSSTGSSPFRTTTDGSSNNITNVTIWDSAAGANGLSIDSSNRAAMNLAAMGGTAINSGCVGALSGFSSAVISTVCAVMGVYVLNTTPVSYQTIGNLTSVGFALDQTNQTTGNIVVHAGGTPVAVVVNAAATTLYGVQLGGIGSAPAYLKLYNATSATCGSGTPVKRLIIPAASTAANGAGSNVSFGAAGLRFSTGLTYCVTTGIADNDTGDPAASTFLVNLDWH